MKILMAVKQQAVILEKKNTQIYRASHAFS